MIELDLLCRWEIVRTNVMVRADDQAMLLTPQERSERFDLLA